MNNLPLPTTCIGGRFLTLNTVVRVNQIEVTRERNEGADESAIHTPAVSRGHRRRLAGCVDHLEFQLARAPFGRAELPRAPNADQTLRRQIG